MSKKGGTAEAEYLMDNGAVDASDVTSLEDYLSKKQPKYKKALINGKWFHFQTGSPKAKDALLAKHTRERVGADGEATTTVDQTMWRTDVIALTWVSGPGGTRILDSEEKAIRFHTEADADEELLMYNEAAPLLGLKDKDEKAKAEKNSARVGGTSGSDTSQPDDSALYPGNSSLS